MKEVARYIRMRSNELAKHPLFTEWLENDAISPADKFVFSPMAIDFVMGFRDLNRYFIIYPEPKNALEEGLNAHAREDATHSAMFIQDWVTLGMDARFGWAPRDLYWWQTSRETQGARRMDFELTRLVWQNPDPLMRFAIIETIEMAGNVFFNRTVPIAEALQASKGVQLPYYGHYHLERETGHLQNADERAFYGAKLTPEQREFAKGLVDQVLEVFRFHFTAWERMAREVQLGQWRYRPTESARENTALRPDHPHDVTAFFSFSHPAGVEGALVEQRRASLEELRQTPFCRWLRAAPPGEFRPLAQRVMLQWVVDNWACADYFLFDTTYAEPKDALERGINRLSTLYASEMNRRYVEWEMLRIDELTGWNASAALRHFWLDPWVEEMRAVFAALRALTFRYPQPLHRYWIMKCFVRFGDAMMNALGENMRRSGVPDEDFPALAGCPERLHPDLPPDPEADEAIARLESLPLSAEDAEVVLQIIAETKAQEARRLAVSWQVIESHDALRGNAPAPRPPLSA